MTSLLHEKQLFMQQKRILVHVIMSNTTVILKNLVADTSSNRSGLILFNAIENTDKNDIVILEIDNRMSLSSSFLNSSIGSYIEKYGLKEFKRKVKFKGNKNQFARISNYIEKFSMLNHS